MKDDPRTIHTGHTGSTLCFRLLGPEAIERIHERSLKLLEETDRKKLPSLMRGGS